MNHWKPTEVLLLVIIIIIGLSILGIFVIRVTTGLAMSDNSTSIINNVVQTMGGGVLTLLGFLVKGMVNEREK